MLVASEDASQTIGQSASSAALSSGRSLVPSTNGDQEIDVDVDSSGEDQPPAGKRAKKSTSEVWQYFEKYMVTEIVDGKPEQQLWAKCKYKGCKNKTSKHRAESRFGTTGFWTYLANYHSIKKGQ